MQDLEAGNLPTGPVAFAKMSGAGNDFIVIDNRDGQIQAAAAELARRICQRRISLGADGLILIEKSLKADFAWRFYNNDGSLAEMCGNGARCAARFAHRNGIAGASMRFETLVGLVEAEIRGSEVSVGMTSPGPLEAGIVLHLSGGDLAMDRIDTGVPHAVVFLDDVVGMDVVSPGREIRFHPRFSPAGTNVDFSAVKAPGLLALRTYERGVEDETLACGTGAVAAALAAARRFQWPSPIAVDPASRSRLTVAFSRHGEGFVDVRLQGDARWVCTGKLEPDAWMR